MGKRKGNVLINRTEKQRKWPDGDEIYMIKGRIQIGSQRPRYSFFAQFQKHALKRPP